MQDFESRPDFEQSPNYYRPPQRSGMETASLVLGILSLISSMFFYLSIPLGALGILFALLSRGSRKKTSARAKAGLLVSATGLLLSGILTAVILYNAKDLMATAEFQEILEEYMDYYYGEEDSEDIDEFLEDFFEERDASQGTPYGDGQPFEDVSPYGDGQPFEDVSPYGDGQPFEDMQPYEGTSPWNTTPYEDVQPEPSYDENTII